MSRADRPNAGSVTFRTHRPGDMGYIVHRHGAIYFREHAWDERFEAVVARIAADFIDNYDPKKDRVWIAEQADAAFLGCVMLVKDPATPDTAKLRLLLVEEEARGLGLGQQLVQLCIDFAQSAGYKRIVLWTQDLLLPARRLYAAAGFKLIQVHDHDQLGHGSKDETWELRLDDLPAVANE